jgi:hypothetical protein
MKKVNVTVFRQMSYTKGFEIPDDLYESIVNGGWEKELDLANETYAEMDRVFASDKWTDNFHYDSDYEIQDDHGGVIVSFDEER